MKTIIVTRFNLNLRFGAPKREESLIPEDFYKNTNYLDKRFALFEKYTVNSIVNQSCLPDEWIIYLHKETPGKYIDYMESLKKEHSFITTVLLDNEESINWISILTNYLKSVYCGGGLTARIDNDDAVSALFVEEFQKKAKEYKEYIRTGKSFFLSARYGIQYDIKTGDLINVHDMHNHFLGMHCDVSERQNNVYWFDHTTIGLKKTVLVDSKHPLWMEVLHDSNYGNSVHWRLNDLIVPYDIYNFYRNIDRKWTSHFQYCEYVIHEFLECIPFYVKTLCKKIKRNY